MKNRFFRRSINTPYYFAWWTSIPIPSSKHSRNGWVHFLSFWLGLNSLSMSCGLWTTTIALTTLLNIPKIKVFAHRFNILNCSVFFFSPTCIKTFNLKEYWSYGIIREKYRGKTPKWKQLYENKEILITTYL